MPEYESSTHLSKSDRNLIYAIFLSLSTITYILYEVGADGFDRISLYFTYASALPALWALAAGHYDKKYRRLASMHDQCKPTSTLREVVDLQEPTYVYKGEVVPLAEALGCKI